MKVLSINNFRINNREKQNTSSYSFKGTEADYDSLINSQVDDFFIAKKPDIINKNTKEIVDDFRTKALKMLSNYSKFADNNNKAVVLQTLAEKYYDNGNIQKAAALTCEFFNNVFDNPKLSNEEKYNEIITKKNLDIIDNYINSTPFNPKNSIFKREHNTKLMAFASETMNKLGYKEFLPFAEKLCEMEYQDLFLELPIKDFRNINTPARKLINKYYDLHQLKTFSNKEQYYKDGMFNLLSKWGLPEHSYILKDVINNDGKKSNKLKAIETIGNIGDDGSIDLLDKILNLKRKGWFAIDCDYNVAASLALSRINDPKANALNMKFFEKPDIFYASTEMKDSIKIICKDMDENCLSKLNTIFNLDEYSIDSDTVEYIYIALAQIDNPKVKDFMIDNLKKFNHRFDILSELIDCIACQKVDGTDIKKVIDSIPPHSEFPTTSTSNYGQFYISSVSNSIRNLKKSIESRSLPNEIKNYHNKNPFVSESHSYSDNKVSSYRHYNITANALNNFAANSNVLEKDYENKPIKNRKCNVNKIVAEVFAKIFIKGSFNWNDVKEDVR